MLPQVGSTELEHGLLDGLRGAMILWTRELWCRFAQGTDWCGNVMSIEQIQHNPEYCQADRITKGQLQVG
jgi:hypothetical protein